MSCKNKNQHGGMRCYEITLSSMKNKIEYRAVLSLCRVLHWGERAKLMMFHDNEKICVQQRKLISERLVKELKARTNHIKDSLTSKCYYTRKCY